ncbi:glycosyltransferase family 4 protein [Flavobacterium sp.]|uniref:glycosyltransferase family 4 protein n=1 Tax=Flavobacterium sp. TaxID=239 RepID=UPI00263051A1|nr:glycosyltransferase family 4 protein [Flavobacterium sp.]MDG2433289.1 glycosyltransferase family 4 protein [Flavobacterium sp.]
MILQLSNDFAGSKVYMNLFKSLDNLHINQYVYVPVRSDNLIDKNKILFDSDNSKLIYSKVLSNYTRINYKLKIRRTLVDLVTKIPIAKVKVIHAHTWFSDGGLAYELHKKTGIPYIVTVRNTDLNLFFKYMLHLRDYGVKILNAASKIIFISTVYKERFLNLNYIKSKCSENLPQKCLVIPNGIDDFWLRNRSNKERNLHSPIKLLYVGNFSKNKNVMRLIQAVELLNNKGADFELTIVGEHGKQQKAIVDKIQGAREFRYLGKIDDKKALLKLFRESDLFTMPSHSETFGLVYIEALSQDTPIIYTINEGIDRFYDDFKIGEGVDSSSVTSISNGIKTICNNYKRYVFNNIDILKNHNWKEIAEVYNNLYQGTIK